MKYNLFIGRWSPFHNGHKYIIDSFVDNGKPVCIAVRDSDEMYPVSLRMAMIRAVYPDEEKVKIIVIPDIETVCVGRKVGYSLVEVPENISIISGTDIREYHVNREYGGGFYNVPKEVKELIEEFENK